MRFAISPHPKAPMIDPARDGTEIIKNAVGEMENLGTGESVREVIRQVGFVNLFFFTKFIAGFNGPFDKLNWDLHLDMANFCQEYASTPGARCALWSPRWSFKTSVGTIGHNSWLLLRNPEGTIGQSHAKYDDALGIMHLTQRTFDSNPFFEWLYPEYVIPAGFKGNNDRQMLLPSSVKTRYTKEASIECVSAGGTLQGKHFSLKFDMDDIVGEQDLGAGRESSVDMYKKRNWIGDVERSMVTDPRETIIFLKATRYGVDDSYSGIEKSARKIIGYDADKLVDYPLNPKGRWTIYWRFIKENGNIIFPERVTQEWLDDLKEDNPWFYWTQMENRPQKSGLNEFVQYGVQPCRLIYDDDKGWLIKVSAMDIVPLSDCEVVQAVDPAAQEDKISAKISRTAHVVLAHAPDNRRFILRGQAGYVGQVKMYEWMFTAARVFAGYLRLTLLEAMGAFKLLVNPLREEERRRGVILGLREVKVTGKKGVRIRNAFLPLVEKGLLYVEEDVRDTFDEEYRRFSGDDRKVDFLDACSIAINGTSRPLSHAEEEAIDERAAARFMAIRGNVAGY